jgi:hypothetical protein
MLSLGACRTPNQSINIPVDRLAGAYEFVSEEVVLTEPADALPPPSERTSRRTAQEWEGQWLFTEGRFSTIMMKKARPNFPDDLGYEATGGIYVVWETSLSLKNELMLSPLERLPSHDMSFKIEGDNLTLIETFHPSNPHLAYGGTRTIVLKRARPNKSINRTPN